MTRTPDKQPLKPCHSFEEWKNNQESKWSKMPYVALAHSKDAWHARDAQVAELEAALKSLVDRLEMIHADEKYKSVWMINQIHTGPYTGPTYTKELEHAKKTLSRDLPN